MPYLRENVYLAFCTQGVCLNKICNTMAHKRKFKTGAVRDSNEDKPNFLSYVDPAVLYRYGKYMKLAEKKYGRANWKKGIPEEEYLESLTRHLIKLQALREGYKGKELEPEVDHASAIMFNIFGIMREQIKNDKNFNN